MRFCVWLYIVLCGICNSQHETPSITNSTGDYYIFTDSQSSRSIQCDNTKSICYIRCSSSSSCQAATIDASGVSTLILRCISQYACRYITISSGPSDTADIECVSLLGTACGTTSTSSYATFHLTNTSHVNIVCDQVMLGDSRDGGSCRYLRVYAQNSETVNVECNNEIDCEYAQFYVNSVTTSAVFTGNGHSSLKYADFYASDSNHLELYCNSEDACLGADIWPPYSASYAFVIFCISNPNACGSVEIRVASSLTFVPNYMEMICPRTSVFTNACDLDWICLDISNSMVTTTKWSDSRYGCSNVICCPWSDDDDILQSNTTDNPLPNSIIPTSSNATAEWYTLSTTVSYRMISCGLTACFIECTTSSACSGVTIYAGITDYLSVICSGTRSCYQMYLTQGPIVQADIDCIASSGYACQQATFTMTNTLNINLVCDSQWNEISPSHNTGNCYNSQLLASNAVNVDVDCGGFEDCMSMDFYLDYVSETVVITANKNSLFQANIYAGSATYLEVQCNANSACEQVDIYPPYSTSYAFKMYCAAITESCYEARIKVPQSTGFTTNYMELICARTNHRSYACDVEFWCLDLSSTAASTSMTYSVSPNRFTCSNTDCCPWANQGASGNYTMQSTFTRSILPNSITPTTDDTTGQYYTITAASTDLLAISCTNTAGCFIECTNTNACDSFTVYAGDTDYLQLICSGQSSCTGIYITEGPKVEANISCAVSTGYACQNAVFIMTNTSSVNLICDSQYDEMDRSSNTGNCHSVELYATNSANVNVDCAGFKDCMFMDLHMDYVSNSAVITANKNSLYHANIYAASATYLEVQCNANSACEEIDIYPPYSAPYAFKMYCAAITESCYEARIKVPQSTGFTTNYMELICARTNHRSYACDVEFWCLDLSSTAASTSMTYSVSPNRFTCSNTDCCPWVNQGASGNYTMRSSFTRTILPNSITPNTDDATGQYYTITAASTNLLAISCTNTAGCFIECTDTNACNSFTIYAGDTDYLGLICSGTSSCSGIYITEGPKVEANISCSASDGYACKEAIFMIRNTSNINLICSSQYDEMDQSSITGNCYDSELWAQDAVNVNIDCAGFKDCYSMNVYVHYVSESAVITANQNSLHYANIYAGSATYLEVQCSARSACEEIDIYPPYSAPYAFKMYCAAITCLWICTWIMCQIVQSLQRTKTHSIMRIFMPHLQHIWRFNAMLIPHVKKSTYIRRIPHLMHSKCIVRSHAIILELKCHNPLNIRRIIWN
eukprot:470928_1